MMGIDPEGTWSWKGFWNVVAAVVVVVAVTAVIAATAGAAAVALAGVAGVASATAATIGATVAATALVSGMVVGAGEISNQVLAKGAENINIGSIAIATAGAAVDGALIGGSLFADPLERTAIGIIRTTASGLFAGFYGLSEHESDEAIINRILFSMIGTMASSAWSVLSSFIPSQMDIATRAIMTPFTTGLIKGGIQTAKLIWNFLIRPFV